MPSKLTINESSDEPMPTEYGGRIETLHASKTTGHPSVRSIKEADIKKKVPVVKGGRIKRITKPSSDGKHWFYDDKDNPLQVRQWVYEVILVAGTLVLLVSFLVIVISSVQQGKLDLQSFLEATGTFLGGMGIGYGYRVHRDKTRNRVLSGDRKGGEYLGD